MLTQILSHMTMFLVKDLLMHAAMPISMRHEFRPRRSSRIHLAQQFIARL